MARSRTVLINDRPIDVAPGETLLQSAHRQGVAIPSACRVGACATCRCRVTRGRVRELTETAYLLSREEIDAGTVLACQSVPATDDVALEVDLESASGLPGVIEARQQLTGDIVELKVRLTAPLAFRAGQYANLQVEGCDAVRSYSFAAPPAGEHVSFFVRKVPGGRLSGLLHDEDLVGRRVHVDGPRGDFWLREGDSPLLCVAGGSGLAPVLALLEDALARNVARPVTLLFGVRRERDLYARARIEELRARWPAPFTFVPVPSEARDDDAWEGERGLVTEHIARFLAPGSHGYVCGSPGMVDAAAEALREGGVPAEHVHFDRFTTQADVPAPDAADRPAAWAGLLDYLKFFGLHAVGLMAAFALFAGGGIRSGVLFGVIAFYVLADGLLGDDTRAPRYRYPGVLTAQLWAALPLLALIVFAAVWSVAPGDSLGAGAWLEALTGADLRAARGATGPGAVAVIVVLTGLMIGMIGTITGHELTHRTWDPRSMVIGRWLLAFSFDTSFAIEHVYGHHRYVSTTKDPATAPRGRNVYHHILASTWKGNRSAWRIETERLRKRRLPVWSGHNAVLRGQLMSLSLVALAAALGGARGALVFIASGLWGKALLEIVNYMEHYGLVRSPERPVEPRHSWNTNRRSSSWTLFNLTRHSHHHAQGEVPYQDLRPFPNAPMMIGGYLTTILIAMVPPLWHHLMTPKVLAWDREHATAEERQLAAEANARSGRAGFRALGSYAPRVS
ncbi:MAG: fatty acid desaturase [Myxococcota bacterium]